MPWEADDVGFHVTEAGRQALLRDGGMVHIRPLVRSDRRVLHRLVDRMSEQSAYLRFFTGGVRTPSEPGRRITSRCLAHLVCRHAPDAAQVRAAQVRAAQVRAAQVRVAQARVAQVRVAAC
ncbi:hypothetical protein Acsp04_66970 [Actinomadura sp. NBRC 104425]|nr:hypothetical protein Acsp04_66970 [Actinomadura sp. NBRC 104425]